MAFKREGFYSVGHVILMTKASFSLLNQSLLTAVCCLQNIAEIKILKTTSIKKRLELFNAVVC